jgi:hypothetical protein
MPQMYWLMVCVVAVSLLIQSQAIQSIETYPKGSNSLLELATRAIARSDNTAQQTQKK